MAEGEANTEVRILVEQTRSDRYGNLTRGQVLMVPAEMAAHWQRHKIAELTITPPPEKPAAKGSEPSPEETEFPCKHPDCVGREPFKSRPAHQGHVTRQHQGKETPPPPKGEAGGTTTTSSTGTP